MQDYHANQTTEGMPRFLALQMHRMACRYLSCATNTYLRWKHGIYSKTIRSSAFPDFWAWMEWPAQAKLAAIHPPWYWMSFSKTPQQSCLLKWCRLRLQHFQFKWRRDDVEKWRRKIVHPNRRVNWLLIQSEESACLRGLLCSCKDGMSFLSSASSSSWSCVCFSEEAFVSPCLPCAAKTGCTLLCSSPKYNTSHGSLLDCWNGKSWQTKWILSIETGMMAKSRVEHVSIKQSSARLPSLLYWRCSTDELCLAVVSIICRPAKTDCAFN